MAQNIKLNVKLSAYTKGALPTPPDLSNYLKDAEGSIEHDGKVYARKNGDWVDIRTLDADNQYIIANKGSGIDLIEDDVKKDTYYISARQKEITEANFNNLTIDSIEDDTTYYVINNSPEYYVNGGTAYSNGDNDYVDDSEYDFNISGGNSKQKDFSFNLLSIDAKGVYNGN